MSNHDLVMLEMALPFPQFTLSSKSMTFNDSTPTSLRARPLLRAHFNLLMVSSFGNVLLVSGLGLANKGPSKIEVV